MTNYSVNKKGDNYVANKGGDSQQTDESSSKWSLPDLKKELETMGVNYNEVFASIKEVLIKTVISVEHHITPNVR